MELSELRLVVLVAMSAEIQEFVSVLLYWEEIFLFFKMSRLALGLTQPHMQ
jgi:hypothetical protein